MTSNSATTRARLLVAAREEFAAHGIDGARVDQIAEKAGVNKERIYGHFGNKEKLFEAAVAQALDEHTTALCSPTTDIAEYVGKIYDFHRKNPELLRLLLWEALHFGSHRLPNEQQRLPRYAAKVDALATTLGTPSDSKTAVTLLALIGLATWPAAVPQLARMMLHGMPNNGADDVRKHLMGLARKVVSTEGEAPNTAANG